MWLCFKVVNSILPKHIANRPKNPAGTRYGLRVPSRDVSSYLQALGSLTVIDTGLGMRAWRMRRHCSLLWPTCPPAWQIWCSDHPCWRQALVPCLLSCWSFIMGEACPSAKLPQGDLEDLLRREVGATSVWHAISFGSLNAALCPGRKWLGGGQQRVVRQQVGHASRLSSWQLLTHSSRERGVN